MNSKKLTKYLQELPITPGVYLMKDSSQHILYIGKAKVLKKRVASYFQSSNSHPDKIKLMVKQVDSLDYIETPSEVEALILEANMIRDLQPKYNSRLKDNKSYPYLAISKEDYPIVMIARKHECVPENQYHFYGPYIDANGLRNSFQLLQKTFKFRTCDLNLSSSGKKIRPCLLASIEYCTAPCALRIGKKEYNNNIHLLKKFLNGQRKEVADNLQQQMLEAAKKLDYENAAKYRDQLQAIESLDKRPLVHNFIDGKMLKLNPRNSLEALKHVLKLSFIPKTIEGVDISHHGGKEAVGSLVCFVDGEPFKQGYRRYKIKADNTEDDYSMMAEVLNRRFTGQDKNRKKPDILLIDGGKGQLQSVQEELEFIGVELPAIVALAKKQEQIYIPGRKEPLNIPKNSLVNRLLCHVRDEAHRFAQSYHHHLKHQNIRKDKVAGQNKRKGQNSERESRESGKSRKSRSQGKKR